ncbi:hypothetical protein ACFOEK_00170 [Litoribrevibacter euphylliae]|uniref:Uncharacterized protein n=1 Tax=Litoribrevibacter euphylliae TaxID=1834034 RepID=A0ABV7HCE1_9GAMM
MSKIKLKPEILSLLSSGNFECFTAPELTDAYLTLPQIEGISRSAAVQFIHRTIKRLCECGFLIPTGKTVRRSTEYQLVAELNVRTVKVGTPHARNSLQAKREADTFKDHLRNRINNYKFELLTDLGEVEEYEALCHENPDKADQIQELYNQARDRYSKNLGRIRALEALVACQ